MTVKESERTVKKKKDIMDHLTMYGKHTRKELRDELDIEDRFARYAIQSLLDEKKVDKEENIMNPRSPYWLVV